MMDVREKLVDIVCDAMEADGCIGHCNHPPCFAVERVVNALIAHGVTVQDNTEISDELLKQLRNVPVTVMTEEPTVEFVQKWISVKDRLPTREDADETEGILAINKDEKYVKKWVWDIVARWPTEFTYWMPLPQPPKGE